MLNCPAYNYLTNDGREEGEMRNSDNAGNTNRQHDPDYARYDNDERYRDNRHIAPNYDSHYDEGEDHVGFVNVIDMDIPFFQLVWLIFKIFLAAIVAASIIALLAALLSWILNLPAVQNILPGDTSWLNDLIKPGGS